VSSILLIINLKTKKYIYILIFNKKTFEKKFYYLIFLPIFSKFILKSKLFRHQIFSLFIILIGVSLLFISFILNEKKSEVIFNIFQVIISASDSFVYVMIKQLTHKYFLSPYLCLLFIGFFSLIILLVGFIIFYLITDKNLDNFIGIFEGESLDSVIYLILFFISCLFLNTLSVLVIFYFSPTLLMATEIINPILIWIKSLFEEGEEKNALDIVLNSVGYSLVFLSSLIYNEIIIFNFFGLNRYTKKYLEKKQREELSSIINNNEDDGLIELKNDID